MNEKNDLTTGVIWRKISSFAIPYLLAAFMQTFYGMADLFVIGRYCDASSTTAVAIGSQVMHMLTVVILGVAMGTTVQLGHSIGAKDKKEAARVVGNSICIFFVVAAAITLLMLVFARNITDVMLTPAESVGQTIVYLQICGAGIPFIVAYNVISSIFRGAGDSRHPMIFVAIACAVNIILDFVFIGYLNMGASGAAWGTILGQAVSVILALAYFKKAELGFILKLKDIHIDREVTLRILSVGIPIAMQDGFIQIAFLVITIIANSRGLVAAAGVGIVEKIICFLFLVPSAFLSAISAFTAQNMGAGKAERARRGLYWGLGITVVWGTVCMIYCQFMPETLVSLFTKDMAVVLAGCQYLRAYSVDTIFAAIHFCFSGYFCGDQKSGISFVHNLISILLIRIPGSYLASRLWPDTLYPMGWAAPLGSLLSAVICVVVFSYYRKKQLH